MPRVVWETEGSAICTLSSMCPFQTITNMCLILNSTFIRCGGVIGMYFLVKKCSLLYLFAGNGTFGQSPYLDVHGEVDMSMR